MEKIISSIVEGISRTYGSEFFNSITKLLDQAIHSDYTFVARISGDKKLSRTVALVAKGELVENFEYELKNTPCKDVADSSICIYPQNIVETFPKDQLLIDMHIEGYLGTPLIDSTGKVMGIVVALYEKPITDQELVLTLFQLFSGRIAAEFERNDREEQLLELNNSLDKKVQERTAELEQVIVQLTKTQDKLLETEKMAALGDLVAGVAHEVNTPLGVAITAESFVSESFKTFKQKFEAKKVTMKDMEQFIESCEMGYPMINSNLNRAKEIVENFKNMATDQILLKPQILELSSYYEKLVSTLVPLLKRKNVKLELKGCDKDTIETYPGCHAQLLTNLINNSVEHAFQHSDSDNRIFIKLMKNTDNEFIVDFSDNGCGIEDENRHKILEPFYTTTRSKGNTGLGLSVSYNLVTSRLNGEFECLPSKQGAHFQYKFKSLN